MDITLALGAELLLSAGIDSRCRGRARAAGGRRSPPAAAAEHFERMVLALGGPQDFLADHAEAPRCRHPSSAPVHADEDGFVSSIRTRELGLAVIELGGGRRVATDTIDHRVGLSQLLGKGARGRPHARRSASIHAADEACFDRAAAIVKSAYAVGDARR